MSRQTECSVIKAANELLTGLGKEPVTTKEEAEWILACWYTATTNER
jgi:hypothetical protein